MRIPRTFKRLASRPGQITRADFLLIGAVVILGVGSLLVGRHLRPKGSLVEISVSGKVYLTHDLTTDAIIEVPGPLGATVVQVAALQARILSSPCRDKICVHMGAIDVSGGLLICAPNEVSVRIVGDKTDALDALTR